MKFIVYTFGTFFGTGFAPVAPGTAGSLAAAVLMYLLPFNELFWIAIILILFITGVLCASQIEREKGHDAGLIVIDEAVGQWLALLFAPHTWTAYLSGFFLFRLMDIWKPYPINKSQTLPKGWGVMIDDVLAGLYTLIVLHLVLYTGLIS
ncbi:MAG: phosphatidylglycerophosphatase A [Caldithrix sp.]|nr:phosphatidylglycerophosphatase A [Caldithrix sp.]